MTTTGIVLALAFSFVHLCDLIYSKIYIVHRIWAVTNIIAILFPETEIMFWKTKEFF